MWCRSPIIARNETFSAARKPFKYSHCLQIRINITYLDSACFILIVNVFLSSTGRRIEIAWCFMIIHRTDHTSSLINHSLSHIVPLYYSYTFHRIYTILHRLIRKVLTNWKASSFVSLLVSIICCCFNGGEGTTSIKDNSDDSMPLSLEMLVQIPSISQYISKKTIRGYFSKIPRCSRGFFLLKWYIF